MVCGDFMVSTPGYGEDLRDCLEQSGSHTPEPTGERFQDSKCSDQHEESEISAWITVFFRPASFRGEVFRE